MFALVPLIIAFNNASHARTVLLASIAFGISFFAFLLSWIRLFGVPAYAGLVGLETAVVTTALLLGFALRRKLAGWAFPLAFLAGEFVRTHVPFGGFSWGGLGYTAHNSPGLLRLAPFGGVCGISLVLLIANALIAAAFSLLRANSGAAALRVGIAALLLTAPSLLKPGETNGEPMRVAMIQGNVPENTNDPNIDDSAVVDSHVRLTRTVKDDFPSLVIWAEGAYDRDPFLSPEFFEPLAKVRDELDTTFLVGSTLEATGKDAGKLINASLLIDGSLIRDYHKRHLVPFGEYVPFRRLLEPIFKELQRVPFDFVAGKDATVFEMKEGKFASVICYESTYPGLVRDFVKGGARFLVVSTNNSSFARSAASDQHVAFSQLRAAENRMWVAHTAISGVSAIVAPDGGVVGRTGLFEEAVLTPVVRFATDITPYARLGDWVPWLAIVILGLALLFRISRRAPELRAFSQPDGRRPLVIVPTYNEVGSIVELVTAVLREESSAHVLVVDDSSPDGTADLVKKTFTGNDRVSVLTRSSKQGLGKAYISGFGWGLERDFTHFIEIDADLSHDPSVISALIDASSGGAAIGSRYVEGGGVSNWGRGRLALSRAGNAYARSMLGISVRDCTSGFRCYERRVLESVDLSRVSSGGYAFQIDVTNRALRAGFNVTEVPITFRERTSGQSKMSRSIVVEAVVRVFVWSVRSNFLRPVPQNGAG